MPRTAIADTKSSSFLLRELRLSLPKEFTNFNLRGSGSSLRALLAFYMAIALVYATMSLRLIPAAAAATSGALDFFALTLPLITFLFLTSPNRA